FLFDAVVTHAEVFGKTFTEPQQFAAKLKFMGNTLKLSASQVNVNAFVANREFEFLSGPDEVRNNLEQNGLEVTLFYQSSSLGVATVTIPSEFLGKISPAMNDLVREDTVDLVRRKDVIGSIGILFRLTLKCEGEPLISGSPADRHKIRRSVSCSGQAPTINPHDVMFLVGDPDPLLQIPSDPCSEIISEEGDERLRLDLDRYRNRNYRVVFPEDDLCMKQKPSFSRLKRLTNEYSQIIDSVAEKVKGMDCFTGAVASPTPSPTSPRTPKDERWIPVPLRSEPEDISGIKPIRYCPVCLHSMSWLPKYMPCPRCNTKSRPVVPHQEEMSAMQIMAEQLVRPHVPQDNEQFCLGPCISSLRKVQHQESEGECPSCHCTCTSYKICAHCRVRKLCEDIYHGPPVPPRRKPIPKPGPGEDFCVIAESEDDELPYLARVFHEMKNLYELHDFKKISAMELRCQSQTLLPRRSIKELTEALYQGGKPRGSQMHDHRLKAGHKRCLPPESVVSRRHGWNWTTSAEARTKGWRPGAILRTSGHVMRYFLMYRERNAPAYQKIVSDEDYRQRMAKPVLSVCKRNGEVFVTLRPLPTLGKRQKPITFRIVKSHLAVALRQIKRALKDQGFEKCSCHKSLMLCTCRDALEKFELNKALRKECRRRLMEPCPEHLVLTDTSVSDVEFDLDVTPPAGTRWLKKPICNTVNHSTQTEKKPPQLPPLYPIPGNPYYKPIDCAVGDRYMATVFGLPGEEVFEDGVFGMEGGGPHGPNPMPCGRVASGRGRRQLPSGPRTGFWKDFPVKAERGKDAISDPIPVRYPKRLLKPAQDAAKAAKQAEIDAAEKKKKGPDMLKYLQAKGTLVRPWNPIDGKDTRPRPPK
ncbi:hypothetical protein KR032_011860, partial [Drosophila birchii]